MKKVEPDKSYICGFEVRAWASAAGVSPETMLLVLEGQLVKNLPRKHAFDWLVKNGKLDRIGVPIVKGRAVR